VNTEYDSANVVINTPQAEFQAGTSNSSSQTRTTYNGAMWNVHKMQSESHTTRSPCQFKQPVTVHAPEVRVEQSPSASAEPNLITDPGVTPTYTHVVDIHDYKAVSQRSLAAGPAVITRLAVAFIIGNPFAGASLGSTMAGAGFSTLCSETSINMIEQGGDIGRSIQAMQKKNIIKTLARSVAAAGLTGTLGGSAASTSLESFAKEFLARAAVNTTLSIAFDGVKPGEALRQGALTAAVNTVGACIANQIGDMASSKMGTEQIGAVTHKIFHTFLGAGLGAATAGITGQDVGLGASSGAVGAVVGETGAEFFDSKHLGDLVAATVAMASGLDVGIAYQASNNATTYNYEAHVKENAGDEIEEDDDEELREYTQEEARESFLKGAREGAESPSIFHRKAIDELFEGVEQEKAFRQREDTNFVDSVASHFRQQSLEWALGDQQEALQNRNIYKSSQKLSEGIIVTEDKLLLVATTARIFASAAQSRGGGKSKVQSVGGKPAAANVAMQSKVSAKKTGADALRAVGKKPVTEMTTQELTQSLTDRAQRAILGQGPVVGTARHKYAESLMKRYQHATGERSNLLLETRFINGEKWQPKMPTKGSVIPDVYDTSTGLAPDYKFGGAKVTPGQQVRYAKQLPPKPDGTPAEVVQMKPTVSGDK